MRRFLVALLAAAPVLAGSPDALGGLRAIAQAESQAPAREAERAPERPSREELTAALAAKVLASGVLVSGREHDDVLAESVHNVVSLFGFEPGEITIAEVDREKGRATVRIGDAPARSAILCGDQGCVVLPRGAEGVSFEPERVPPAVVEKAWPVEAADAAAHAGVDAGKLSAAVDAAFEPGADTAAFLVVLEGRILAERYGAGAGPRTRLESWSMGKSLTAILYARALHLAGLPFEPFVPAPIPEWSEDDPRAAIEVADLLRMQSGLRFTHPAFDPPSSWDHAHGDHFYVYSGAIDVFEFARTRPPEHEPGTVGRYRNCDPLLVGYLLRRLVEERGESYLAFPQRALFDPLGIQDLTLETDPHGNFVMTGYELGSARAWTKLGLLVLQDGVWEGERLLPEGFTDFVSAPAPAWEKGNYGGLFWINGNGRWNLPESAYYMAGFGTQHVILVPTHGLVVTRMGHQRGESAGARALNRALGLLMEAIPERD